MQANTRETAIPAVPIDLAKTKDAITNIHNYSISTLSIDPKKDNLAHNAMHLLNLKDHKDTSWKYEEQTLAVII
jgi:hypothetical protein